MVVGVFGPTASGKSDVAEALVDVLDGELVSADAMQAYRGLPILTNQSERPTRLVGIWPLDHEASVGEYQDLAQATIDELVAAGLVPVVVGGTGLYLRAALAGLELPPPAPAAVRSRLERLYDRVGPERAHAALAERDPAAAARVHANDRRRVVRALELVEVGASLAPTSDTLWGGGYRHPTVVVGLEVPRDELWARIEARTRSMVERGVVEEARGALAGSVSPDRAHDPRPTRLCRAAARGGGRDVQPARAALRRVPAEVDAPDPRRRHHRREPTCDRGGR